MDNLLLVVPLLTAHINATVPINNHVMGIGIEAQQNRQAVTLLYLPKSSFKKPSWYLGYSYHLFNIGDVKVKAGIALATGYEKATGYHVSPVPAVAIDYAGFRLATSYPAGNLLCDGITRVEVDGCNDFVNLQYMYKF